MDDFDITSFRSKSRKIAGKQSRLRDPTKVATSFMEYLEKRRSLQVYLC